MLFFSLWPNAGGFAELQAGFDALAEHPAVCDEVRQILELGLENAEHVSRPLEAGLQQVTMRTDAHYSRDEILAALDWADIESTPRARARATRRGWCGLRPCRPMRCSSRWRRTSGTTPRRRCTATTRSPGTVPLGVAEHHDGGVGDGPAVPAARGLGTHVLLFTRQVRSTGWGGGAAYQCLGPVSYVTQKGRGRSRSWRLRHGLPADTFEMASSWRSQSESGLSTAFFAARVARQGATGI